MSFQEVNPLNLLEAKVLGIPVLTTPAGGSQEQMVADEIDGFAIPDTGLFEFFFFFFFGVGMANGIVLYYKFEVFNNRNISFI